MVCLVCLWQRLQEAAVDFAALDKPPGGCRKAKKKSATLISSERTRMKHFLSELLLRKGPLSYAAIGAVLYQNKERERVIDSYGGVRAFVLQHKGTFLYKDVQTQVEDVLKGDLRTYTTVCLEQSLVA